MDSDEVISSKFVTFHNKMGFCGEDLLAPHVY